MIGVDKIGDIRRAYFEQHRPIKEIVRTLSVSRATVRKVMDMRTRNYSNYNGFIRPVTSVHVRSVALSRRKQGFDSPWGRQ